MMQNGLITHKLCINPKSLIISSKRIFQLLYGSYPPILDTTILHHAFISIFIALWAVITRYVTILMAILSYFTRFIMKREDVGSWNSGWKRSKYWKPILHSSKNPETPRKSVLELIRIIERKKHLRGPTPWPGGWGARPPLLGLPPVSWGP